jgi:hypothetical protein
LYSRIVNGGLSSGKISPESHVRLAAGSLIMAGDGPLYEAYREQYKQAQVPWFGGGTGMGRGMHQLFIAA